jgi:NAD(P)-dependent dehydrogenase (short-subunit alcohol dehydrogenase family)
VAKLLNKRALITGGTSGIGLETARAFLIEGARVAITGYDQAQLDAARTTLPGDVQTILADAGDVAGQAAIAAAVQAGLGGLDVLFVNAGIADFRPLPKWDEAGFDRSFAINVKGPFFLIQALLPHFADPASIVLNASIYARLGMPDSSVYAASKAALVSLARTLSGALITRGIRVNAISPGPVATPLHDKVGMAGAALDDLISQIPLGRRGRVNEIAQAVVFLASDDGAFAVGSEFIIDGGMGNL